MTCNIFSPEARNSLASPAINASKLMTFEELDQFSGFVLYEANLPKLTRDPANLNVNQLADRAQIYIDGESVGVLSREHNIQSLPISAGFGKQIQILVENQGRINFQANFDRKGILGNVTIQTYEPCFEEISGWSITPYPFDDYSKIEKFISTDRGGKDPSKNGFLRDGPAILHGEFFVNGTIADTWWNTTGWGKGVLFVNGFNLGRYWPLAGPQITLYIPAALLKHGVNSFVILEQQKVPENLVIDFTDKPDFSED